MFAQDIRVFSFTRDMRSCLCVCVCARACKKFIPMYIFILYFLLTFEKKDDETARYLKRGEANCSGINV